MPKIQIELPIQAYEKLKKYAKEDDRSLNKYVTRGLIYLSDNPYHIPLESVNKTVLNLSTLPEGATIKTKVTPPPKPLTEEEKLERFQKKAKKIVGHELELEENYMLMDIQSDNIYYDKNYEKLYREGGSLKVVYIYDLPEERQEEYLRDFKDWEDHENRGLNTLGYSLSSSCSHSHSPL